MAQSDFVTVSISLSKAPVSRQGFGTPMILAPDCPVGFTERVREYTSLAGLVSDGFAVSGPTYLQASVLLEQDPTVPLFKVGRLANAPTQKHTFTPVASTGTLYAGWLNGTYWSFTSVDSVVAHIITGIEAAITAAASALSVSLSYTANSTTLDVTASVAGQFDSFEVANPDVLSVAQTHADPGAATDLNAILAYDSDFYAILNAFDSKLMGLAIATWTEAQAGLKFYAAQTLDSASIETSASGGADLAAAMEAANYNYSAAFWSPATGDFLGAAECGTCLSQDAGSENWAMQTPTITAATLTETQRTNLVNRNANFCESLGGQNNTFPGQVASGQYIDTIRFRSWVQVNMQADVISAIKAQAPKKLPYTDQGAHIIGTAIQGVLDRGVKAGGLVKGSTNVVIPPVSGASPSDRAARLLNGLTWTAELAGAINKATISGQLTS